MLNKDATLRRSFSIKISKIPKTLLRHKKYFKSLCKIKTWLEFILYALFENPFIKFLPGKTIYIIFTITEFLPGLSSIYGKLSDV